ncbi:MAG: hypothetical protein V4734_04330 [Terriglobus sp.]
MAVTQLRKAEDGSSVLSLSQETLTQAAFGPESSVETIVREGEIVIRNEATSILDRALAEFHLMPRDSEEDRAWVNAPRVGRELI